MRTRFFLMVALLAIGAAYARDYDPKTDDGLVIHEWGTFTSIQGSDGHLMIWNPFETDELPKFVYDRNRPLTNLSTGQPATIPVNQFIPTKARSSWRQRMETPVIYAYSEHELELDVRVDFPSGQITEWYPQVSTFGPSVAHLKGLPIERDSFVQWKNLTVEAARDAADGVLPLEPDANHYYEARDVDANLLTANKGLSEDFKPQKEKFLFYRGVGDFSTPLHVRFDSPNSLVLHNTGKAAIPYLLFLEVIEGKAAFQVVSGLPGKKNHRVHLEEAGVFQDVKEVAPKIGAALVNALVANGLYEKEAKSMVATWKSSWLTESGSRVLYILPRSWTDKTLPIRITPAPKELERVMVGRAELITPRIESELQTLFTQYDRGESNGEQTISKIAKLDLGRFTEPALTRMKDLQYRRVSQQVHGLKGLTRVAMSKQQKEGDLAVASTTP